MQHLRGDDEVERPRRKWERQRIAGDSGHREFARCTNQLYATVEPKDVERHSMLGRKPPQPIRDVAGAGTDIEQRCCASDLTQPGRKFYLYRMNPAEESIRKRDIAM